MADYTKQEIFDIITEYLETYGSAIGEYRVRELTAEDLEDVENMKILTIPGMDPTTEEWVQTNMANMIRPITEAVSDWEALEESIEQAVADAQGADNVDANMSTQSGAVLLTVTNRDGISTTKEVGFRIARTYDSIAAMNADAANVNEGQFALIAATGQHPEEDPDNAKLFVRNAATAQTAYTYLTDLSGAQGLKGDTPVITADQAGSIYSDGVKVTDIIKDTIAAVNAWFSDTASTGVRKQWNDFWTSINSSWNSFWGTSVSDTGGVRYKWTNWFSGVQSAFTAWFGVDDTTEGGVQKAWKTLSTQADNDHTQAVADHNTASGDHLTADRDHTTAGQDHAQAGNDHTQAGSDHTTAGQDHTQAEQDHLQAVSDHQDSVAATDLAEEYNSHPPYIADGTQAKPGDVNYWYIWNHATQTYGKDAYARGSDLDYSSMTEQEKQDLANRTADVNYNSQTGYLEKTKNGVTSNIVPVYTKAQIDGKLAIYYNPATKGMVFPADTSRVEYDSNTKGMVFH